MHNGMERTEATRAGRALARVVKFGGSSVTGGDRIDTIADVVRDRSTSCRPVLVVSAFAEVTATLERAAISALGGGWPEEFAGLTHIHADAVRQMTDSGAAIRAAVETLLAECERLLGYFR